MINNPQINLSNFAEDVRDINYCKIVSEKMKESLELSNEMWEYIFNFQPASISIDQLIVNLHREKLYNLLDPLLFRNDISDEILMGLSDDPKIVDQLGHRKGPLKLLWKIAREHEIPEAILTIGNSYYCDPEISSETFGDFIKQFVHVEWLMRSLIHQTPSQIEKFKIYRNMLLKNYKLKLIQKQSKE